MDHFVTAEGRAGWHAEEFGESRAFVTIKGLKLGDGDVVQRLWEINDARLTL